VLQQTQEPQQRESVSVSPVRLPQTDQTEAGSENKRLAYIDGLRGLAVAGVVLFHARTWASTDWKGLYFLGVGRAGVDLFLVLTGFCLFLPLIRQGDGSIRPLDLREYVRRRARRILPPYYAALLIAIVVCGLVYCFAGPSWLGQPFQTLFPWRPASVLDVAMHLMLAHGFNNHTAHGIEGAFWTLSLEAQFYTLFPLLAWVARREYITLAVLITILTSLSYRYMMHENHPVVLLRFVGDEICVSRLAEFGLGMLAAGWTVGAWGGVRAAAL
jgi:peptidoglycan/LPS O-acetylase OafA/YrhL